MALTIEEAFTSAHNKHLAELVKAALNQSSVFYEMIVEQQREKEQNAKTQAIIRGIRSIWRAG